MDRAVKWLVWIYGEFFVGHGIIGFVVLSLPVLFVFAMLWAYAINAYEFQHRVDLHVTFEGAPLQGREINVLRGVDFSLTGLRIQNDGSGPTILPVTFKLSFQPIVGYLRAQSSFRAGEPPRIPQRDREWTRNEPPPDGYAIQYTSGSVDKLSPLEPWVAPVLEGRLSDATVREVQAVLQVFYGAERPIEIKFTVGQAPGPAH